MFTPPGRGDTLLRLNIGLCFAWVTNLITIFTILRVYLQIKMIGWWFEQQMTKYTGMNHDIINCERDIH